MRRACARREQIGAVVNAVAPKPVNILMSGPLGFTVAELAALGVRRISVGGALSRVAWGAFIRAAKQIAEEGRFDTFADGVPHAELNAFFRDDMKKRGCNEREGCRRLGAPVGPPVDATAGAASGAGHARGPFRPVVRLDAPRHGAALWQAVKGHDALWTYMSYGPFADSPRFRPGSAARAAHRSILLCGRRSDGPRGRDRDADVDPARDARHRGRQYRLAPSLQRTPLATETQYLLARYAFETLGYRRYEWKCYALNAPLARAPPCASASRSRASSAIT